MAIHVEVVRQGPVLVARVEGDLDMVSAAQLRDPVEEAWNAGSDLRHIVLNLKGLSFLDSTGIAVILGRYRAALARGGRLVVVDANARVRRMLEISGALRLVELADSEAEALARLAPRKQGRGRRRRRRQHPT
ncbi:STAS domain-containing protein [Geochorda subterranea]|uniref:Anti-sigma factor antagonist n=1 Tax=Geochorda subterranea TaxID=3109564 RepID=A0ABZ1BL49_9FIRM|nr:anti-sigma factor antagonist [Limnochorda sp. LNt]WRP13290.1 anti-sigma factor antagonist [Limnochorda sp. LNt]